MNAAPLLPGESYAEVIELIDILCVNESEASFLANVPVESINDARNAVQLLAETGAKLIIITMGANGAVFGFKNDHDELTIGTASAPKVEAKDTTGAGDAFVGKCMC